MLINSAPDVDVLQSVLDRIEEELGNEPLSLALTQATFCCLFAVRTNDSGCWIVVFVVALETCVSSDIEFFGCSSDVALFTAETGIVLGETLCTRFRGLEMLI